MNSVQTDGQLNEQSLVQLYMTLTGTTESHARNVFMYLHSEESSREANPSLLSTEGVSPNGLLEQ